MTTTITANGYSVDPVFDDTFALASTTDGITLLAPSAAGAADLTGSTADGLFTIPAGSGLTGPVDGIFAITGDPAPDPGPVPLSTTPLEVTGYAATRASRNVIHDTIDGGLAVVLVSPRPRSGTLELLYDDEAAAFAALNMHALETTFSLSSTERGAVGMTYVLAGDLTIELEGQTRHLWLVRVAYQEVTG